VTRDLLIGIDAGTSMIKAVAFDLEGRQQAIAALPNIYQTLPGGGVEQDMAWTWAETARVLRLLADELPDLAGRAAALAVTGQGDGTWLVDGAGEPVAPAWLWLDSRAAPIVAELRAAGIPSRTYRITGCGLNACMQSIHLLWLKRHRPEVLARAASAHHCKDWLYFKLTGVRATDPAEGVFTFGSYAARSYAPEILDLLGLGEQAHLLPPLLDGTRVQHPLAPPAAAATGLLPGTPVVLGHLDTICAGLGGGIYAPGQAVGCSIIGTTGMHMRLATGVEDVRLNEAETGYTKCFPVPDCWVQMQSNMAATLNIDWIVDCAAELLALFGAGRDRRAVLRALDAGVADRPPGRILFHPFICEAGERGPFLDPAARAQLIGLSSGTGFLDLVRAVYEGLAFAARDCYQTMGHAPAEVRLTGGAAQSPALRAILAAVLGQPVRRSDRAEAGAAGAAMMAAVGLGHCADMAACVDAWVTPGLAEPERPDPGLAGHYAALFPVYRQSYRQLAGVWHELARIRRDGHG
jgi:erythritol kinase